MSVEDELQDSIGSGNPSGFDKQEEGGSEIIKYNESH